MKSSPEKINTANTKHLEPLETKLQTKDLYDTYENICQPSRDL